jgi:hypothetical protein
VKLDSDTDDASGAKLDLDSDTDSGSDAVSEFGSDSEGIGLISDISLLLFRFKR